MKHPLVLIVFALALLNPAAAQQQPACPAPFTVAQVEKLVASPILEARQVALFESCGVGFSWSAEIEARLRRAGATPRVLDTLRRLAVAERRPPEDREATLRADVALWEVVKERRTAADYEDYLKRFPDGTFARIAREELDKIRSAERAAQAEAERQRREAEEARERERRAAEEKRRAEQQQQAELSARRERALRLAQELVRIEPGEFTMGCSPGDNECDGNEHPPHRVQITKPFEMGKYEVTQAQWEAVMGSNPSRFKGPDRPVEQVSWEDAQQFITRLNARNDGYRYRLPTEAEWEYAARAGSTGKYYGDLNQIAWYDGNSGNQTQPVGQKQPNAWGLHDMLGNVWEWCSDWYGEKYYRDFRKTVAVDPAGPQKGKFRSLRGGSWFGNPRYLRVSNRNRNAPGDRVGSNGFRLLRERFP